MLNQVLWTLALCAFSSCQDSVKYCVVDGDSKGIAINNGEFENSSVHYGSSKFLDNTTTELNLRDSFSNSDQFEKLSAIQKVDRAKIIIDMRWEKLVTNNHEVKREGKNIFNYVDTYYLNVKKTPQGQWYLLKMQGNRLYTCENQTSNCIQEARDFSNSHSLQNDKSLLWKIHTYHFFHLTSGALTTVINQKPHRCEQIKKGCFTIFVAPCPKCEVQVALNSTYFRRIEKDTGGGEWKTIQLNLTDFTSCFNINITMITSNTTSDNFWAIGEFAYLSKVLNCKENKRYIQVNDTKSHNVTCESATNENIELVSKLPTPAGDKNDDKPPETYDDKPPETYDDKPQTSSAFLIPIGVVVVLVIIVTAGLAIYYKMIRKHSRFSSLTLDHLIPRYSKIENEESVVKIVEPIKTSEFSNYVKQVLNPNRKSDVLEAQFKALPSGYSKSYDDATRPNNIHKNRFVKLYPYDENRVRLGRDVDADSCEDYINASFIKGVNGFAEYIITQNPIKETVQDFWRMIWEQEVDHIVMITFANEEYERYWPKLGTSHRYGRINVFTKESKHYEFYHHRVFDCSINGPGRKINHLHFFAWPKENVSPHIFLELVDYLLKIPHQRAPVVFHCLAGLGRSATLLLCDIALRASTSTNYINLFETTKELRMFRADMIQNLKQYQLAHLIISEYLNYNDWSYDINEDFPVRFSALLEGNTIKKAWSKEIENKKWIYEAVTRSMPCSNLQKLNRYENQSLLPVEHSRVHLQGKEQDYVNAMFVNDYMQNKNLIVAQQPSKNTIADFWLMVLQNHVKIIVNLNELDTSNWSDCVYFPTNEKKLLIVDENIKAYFEQQEDLLNYERISIKVYTNGKFCTSMFLINVRNWPKIKDVPGCTDLMINIWEVTQEVKPQNFPVVICCDDGIKASSLVTCFFYMVDKMIQEKKCDVVGAVKAVRRSHIEFINFEQFVFLHHCALTFYKNRYIQHNL